MGTSVDVDGHLIQAHLDTGSPAELLLPLIHAEELGLSDQLTTVGRMRTVDAEREIFGAPFDGTVLVGGREIAISTLRFADVPVANVGMGALAGRTMVLDKGGHRFSLSDVKEGVRVAREGSGGRAPGNAAPPAAGQARPMGLRAQMADGFLNVAGVEPGSRAEAAGLQAGDHVVAINGQLISDIPPAQLRERMGAVPLVLTIERDGAQMEVEVGS
jgi:membrane-associated protease RseP (regulator of RpoE activity)